jgi:hypothetical protein
MTTINPTSFASTRVQDLARVVIPMVSTRPNLRAENSPPRTPGELIGYYNPGIDRVEVFVASAGGTFWREIG